MLYTSNLILLVGATEYGDFSPKKVTIYSTSQNIVLCSSWPFLEKIRIAKINKKRMLICERNFMHVYTTSDMKILQTLEIGYITLGKLVLSPNCDKNNFACYSSNDDEGVIKVFDTIYMNIKTTIRAHKSPVLRISINFNGDMLCSSSCKGTIIRVFNLPKGDKIITYKRGMSSAYIFCINFSLNSEKILITSDTGTLHIFDLKEDKEE
jgi:autophagy-related protein 18